MSETFKAVVTINGMSKEMDVIKKQNGFDPMTGQPVMEFVCQNGFDPMTGQPVYIPLVQDGFDGMTGQACYKAAGNSAPTPSPMPAQAGSAQAGSAQTVNAQAAGIKKFLPLIIGGGALIVAAVIIIIGITSGAFLSKRNKVALAAYKTINDSTFGKTLIDSAKLYDSNELSTNVKCGATVEGYNVDFDVTSAFNRNKSQISVDGSVAVGGVLDQSVKFYFDDSMVAAALPDVSKSVYFYNYKDDNDGYFADLIDTSTKGDISDVNTIISGLSTIMKKSSKTEKAVTKAITKAYKHVNVTSIDKEEFEIDEKDRKCKGYEMTITGDNIAEFITASSQATASVNGETLAEIFESLANLTGMDFSDYDISDADTYEDMADLFSNMDDIVIDFYIYGGKLAAIETEYEGAKLYVEFRGGDNRCSNMVFGIKSQGMNESIKLKSKMDGKNEEGSIIYNKSSVASYEYNPKTGKFKIDIMGLGGFDGIFKVSGSELSFSTDVNVGIAAADIEMVTSKKAKISKPKGNYEDLGNADEDDLEEIFEDLGDSLGSLFQSPALIEDFADELGDLF